MKQAKLLTILLMTVICFVPITIRIIVPYVLNDIVDYEQSVYSVNPDTGATTYSYKVYHWKHGDIVMSEYYYDITQQQIDSLTTLHHKLNEQYKKLP